MGKALYRTYRSRTLDEVVGQEPVTTALKNALKTGQISHAYLFSGPHGVGKTSIARILAYEINGLPYNADQLPIDIIEIDAASNRRIDEIRDLREKVRIAPVSARYKVYIIDEVHMLTREAFNALLKTLEEPPEHVVFILATTESHKLPETIVSRTQRYSFKLISNKEIANHLQVVAKKEKITITPAAAELIAQHSGGSLRDALSILDQLQHMGDTIDESSIQAAIGLPASAHVDEIIDAVAANDAAKVIGLLQASRDEGISPTLLAQAITACLQNELAVPKPRLELASALKLMQGLLATEASQQPETVLELALLGTIINRQKTAAPVRAERTHAGPPLTISKPVAEAKRDIARHEKAAKVKAKLIAAPVTAASPVPMSLEIWQAALDQIRIHHNTLYSVLRMAKPDASKCDKNLFCLWFDFPFHQKRINEATNKQKVLKVLESFNVHALEITCELNEKPNPEPVTEAIVEPLRESDMPQRDDVWLSQIKTVFGGAEVLE